MTHESNSQTILAQTANRLVQAIEAGRRDLLGIEPGRVHEKPSPERWSFSEVVGHLVDSACNNHQRFVRAQQVENLEFPKYDQNVWVAVADYRKSDWEPLVSLWFYYNLQLSILIRNIASDKLQVPCSITPYEPCTLEFLVTDYVVHLEHHLSKIRERI